MGNLFDAEKGIAKYFKNADGSIFAAATNAIITFPSGCLEAVTTNDDANDVRQVLYSILEGFTDNYSKLSGESLSDNISVSRSATVVNDNQIRKTYTISMLLDLPSLEASTDGDTATP